MVQIDHRMQSLIDDHNHDLDRLLGALVKTQNTIQLRQVLFDRPLNPVETVFATGETLAHINYLLNEGAIRQSHKDGVAYYQVTTD